MSAVRSRHRPPAITPPQAAAYRPTPGRRSLRRADLRKGQNPMAVWLRCVATCITFLLAETAAAADPVEDFYRGKTIRVLIGYGAGGGYDLYGRLAAEFLGRHIPGHPTIIAQNMPGGGSFIAAANLYKD